MKLVNRTNNKVLANHTELADTFLSRLIGLIGKRELVDQALIIKRAKQVHTFFMSFPIDLIFLDEKWIVVRSFSSMKPFRISPRIRNSHLVVELPSGSVRKSETSIGDILAISQ